MKYFPETEKLLFEPNFLEFIHKQNDNYNETTDYPSYSNMVGLGHSFYLTIDQWKNFAAQNLGFKTYVLKNITRRINKEWKSFNDNTLERNENSLIEFKSDLFNLLSRIQQLDYFKPIVKEVIELIKRIAAHYDINPVLNHANMEENRIEPMQWNANLNILTTMFYDLSKKELSNKKMSLDATAEQIKTFISMCFVDKKGSSIPKSTLDTYFQEGREDDKKATKSKIQVDEYFEHDK